MKVFAAILFSLTLFACKSAPIKVSDTPAVKGNKEAQAKGQSILDKGSKPQKEQIVAKEDKKDTFDQSKIVLPESVIAKKRVIVPEIKAETKVAEVAPKQPKNEPEKEYTFNDLIEMQKKIVAEKKDERNLQKLAILYLLAERFPEAEEILSTTKFSDELMDVNLAYLYNVLGEHKLAEYRLNAIIEKWRKIEGVCIEKIELCQSVEGFRHYKVYDKSNTVKPGSPILIYVEPKNFLLQNEGQNFALHLKYNWQLYDNLGNEIKITKWQSAKGIKEDIVEFKGEVNEFYQTFLLPLPQNLAIGRYILKITVEDLNSGKAAFATIELDITEL